jgi:hypothetical protein
MEQSVFIRRKYHRTLNTCHLFETFLYSEFYSKISETDDKENLFTGALTISDEYIDQIFLVNVFNEIWNFSEQIDTNPNISEDLIHEILTTSNDDFVKLTREFDLFDYDYKILESIKDYSINIIKEHNNIIKMKHFYKNYNIFLKNEMISKFKIELLIAEDNICQN